MTRVGAAHFRSDSTVAVARPAACRARHPARICIPASPLSALAFTDVRRLPPHLTSIDMLADTGPVLSEGQAPDPAPGEHDQRSSAAYRNPILTRIHTLYIYSKNCNKIRPSTRLWSEVFTDLVTTAPSFYPLRTLSLITQRPSHSGSSGRPPTGMWRTTSRWLEGCVPAASCAGRLPLQSNRTTRAMPISPMNQCHLPITYPIALRQ